MPTDSQSKSPDDIPNNSQVRPIAQFPYERVANKLSWDETRWPGGNRPSLVPFFGAGASSSVGQALAKDGSPSALFPKGKDLARRLAKDANPCSPSFNDEDAADLGKSARYYEIVVSRDDLRNDLHKEFSRTANNLDATVQDVLTGVGANMFFTTNYGTLIEQALMRRKAKFVVVVEIIDPFDFCVDAEGKRQVERITHRKLLLLDSRVEASHPRPEPVHREQFDPHEFLTEDCSIVYKMHGSVCPNPSQSQFLISDNDYVNFMLNRNATMLPAKVAAYVATRKFLFLGYSLRDWNFRLLFAKLSGSHLSSRRSNAAQATDGKSFAVMRDSSPMDQEIWSKSGVQIFSGELSTFARDMRGVMDRIAQQV